MDEPVPTATDYPAPAGAGGRAQAKGSARLRADLIRPFRCKHLIAVLEDPHDIRNIGTVIRNVNAPGVEKIYVVDPRRSLPDDRQEMRKRGSLANSSVSAVKWSFVKRFDSTEACLANLQAHRFTSIVTSSHQRGRATSSSTRATTQSKPSSLCGSATRLAISQSELCVGIPMFGMVQSLNLGTVSGIVLYEVTRQRRDYQSQFRKRNRRCPIAAG